MRRRRVSASIRVWSSAWPMCRLPVTFGGGSTIEYAGLLLAGSAVKYPASSQLWYSPLSTAAGSHCFGRASAAGESGRAVTAQFYERAVPGLGQGGREANSRRGGTARER